MSDAAVTVRPYGVFIVRLWLEPGESAADTWRASVMNALTRKKVYFSSPEALSRYLADEGAPRAGGAA